ncbi:MAG: hypothetical protein K0U74_15385 [Alphaproteobacteria bacterium]|nr:hypothetical protein [Alphaproteobacteria bacterium]
MTAKTPKQKGLGAMERLLRSGRAVAARTIMTPNAANPKVQPKVTIHTRPPETGVALTTLDPNTPDDLTKIRRIDAALAERLNKLGIIHFDQIANWSATDVRSLRAALRLGNEIHRHAWIEQAAQLALRRAKAIGGLHPERPASTAPPPAYEKPDDQVPTPHHASDQYPAAERQAPQPEAPQAEAPRPEAPLTPGHSTASQRSTNSLVAEAVASIRSRLLVSAALTSIATKAVRSAQTAPNSLSPATTLAPAPLPARPLNALAPPDGNKVSARFASALEAIRATVPPVSARFPIRHQPPIETPRPVAPAPSVSLPPLPATPTVDIAHHRPEIVEPAQTPPVSIPQPSQQPPMVSALPPPSAPPAPALFDPPELPDELALIDDMPVFVAARLNELGVTRFVEIADFNAEDIAALSIDCDLGNRVSRECWLEQAAALARGHTTKAAALRKSDKPIPIVAYPGPMLVPDPGLRRRLDARNEQAALQSQHLSAQPEAQPETEPETGPEAQQQEAAKPVAQATPAPTPPLATRESMAPAAKVAPQPQAAPTPPPQPIAIAGQAANPAPKTKPPLVTAITPIAISRGEAQKSTPSPLTSPTPEPPETQHQATEPSPTVASETAPAAAAPESPGRSTGQKMPAIDRSAREQQIAPSFEAFEGEEAEVIITPRKQPTTSLTIDNEIEPDKDAGTLPDAADGDALPGHTLRNRLSKTRKSGAPEVDRYSAYREDVAEAWVNIVRSQPKGRVQAVQPPPPRPHPEVEADDAPAPSPAPDVRPTPEATTEVATDPDRQSDATGPQKPTNRFLKALRGR